jgi:prepilin-type N-terminal cleavage/methylation domain-containing protein
MTPHSPLMLHVSHFMKNAFLRPSRSRSAFTLIELLVVISIIAILAALILPALAAAKKSAQKTRAQLQVGQIANAINSYETDNSGKFPVSSIGVPLGSKNDAMDAASSVLPANGGPEDFTYGGTFNGPSSSSTVQIPGLSYKAGNEEVMAILMDIEHWPINPSTNTIETGHVKNPQRTHYLNATQVSQMNKPGVGPDGVYRDPWGNPYVITVDLNYDGKTRDAFYRSAAVSQQSGTSGYNGLINSHTPPTPPTGNSDFFECNSPVMVWSAGPDGMIDPNSKAIQGANKDNILSWKQ